ncbi:hypothetical protein [Microbacterium sp.]|uniref:hypothetical protein n=1 Tax=Microbacterium sp. TaxID=51671 RepID=UPI0028118359|nr:hypothetical protein [Microbacterium sp.]
MNANRPEPGTPMMVQWSKWDGSPHWANEEVYLGQDEWGDWLGQPVGWRNTRPGRDFAAGNPNVTLIPHPDAELGAADFALTVNRRHPKGMRIYIDLAWELRWIGETGSSRTDLDLPVYATGIDMDLDVVRVVGERGTWIDDRDEWEEHLVQYGYPAHVITHLEALALDLEQRVLGKLPPFDDATADVWLDRLESLGLDR